MVEKNVPNAIRTFCWLSSRYHDFIGPLEPYQKKRVKNGEFKISTIGGLMGTIKTINVSGKKQYLITVAQVSDDWKEKPEHYFNSNYRPNVFPIIDYKSIQDSYITQ